MMFSSNQILQFSGSLSHKDELKNALEFALNASGWLNPMTRADNPCKCVYQVTKDGRYCIGWGGQQDGWNEYPFDFDADIISQIIVQHLTKQDMVYDENCIDGWDGSYCEGFLMKNIEYSFADMKNGIQKPNYGIVSFEPYTCYYSK